MLAIGSSTVFPVTELLARKYEDRSTIVVPRSTGSSLGIRNLLAGGAAVGAASRPIKASDYEKVDCDPAGIGEGGKVLGECQGVLPLGVQFGSDLLAVIVHPQNTWATDMTVEQAAQIFSGAATWAEVFPGGPAQAPALFVPDALSGTYDFFAEATGTAPPTGGSSDDSVILRGVAADPNAIGFLGLAYALGQTSVQVASVGGVNPLDLGAAAAADYAFFRPLFVYVDANARDPAAFGFACALLGEEGQRIVADVGYVALDAAPLAALQDEVCGLPPAADAEQYDFSVPQFLFCKDMSEVLMVGSSTVYPISAKAVAENPNTWLYPQAASVGSSVGLATFLAGGADLGAASRKMKAKDYEAFDCPGDLVTAEGQADGACQGKLPKGVLVGRDTLAIIANPAAGLADISSADLVAAFGSGAGYTLCVPDVQSGTRDFFEEAVGPVADGVLGYTSDEDLVACIADNPDGIGFVGYSYVPADVTVVTVDGVDPSEGGAYPLIRPLFYYYDGAPEAHNRQVLNFLCTFLSPVGQDLVASVGYVPLTAEEIAEEQARLALPCLYEAKVSVGLPATSQ